MTEEIPKDSLDLSRQVRKDLKELSRYWTFRGFEEIHAASLFYDFVGMGLEEMLAKLELLEGYIRKEDLQAISDGDWPIYGLVNYYDHLIDLLKERGTKAESELRSIEKWKKTAGLYAQIVCHLEDIC
ncbi:MAG TPA: hypothetical protein VLU38_00490 [Methanomassiliicoccales archaeon]|nr:hypothetical protein [Methanomassiliicoccales archaeon]